MSDDPVSSDQSETAMDRRSAVARIVAARGEGLIISGLGSPTYDLHAAGDDERNYYLWGAMGGAALVGLGVALAQPNRHTIVVTGDGEQLMGLGALATIGVAAPPNLDVFVIDNEHYGETGMQASHTGRGVDLAAAATACGFVEAGTLSTMTALEALLDGSGWAERSGPRLWVLKVDPSNPPRSLPTRDAVLVKNRFRSHLGLTPN